MPNRFTAALEKVSAARSACVRLEQTVAPVLNESTLADFGAIGDALAGIETDLKAASDVLDSQVIADDITGE